MFIFEDERGRGYKIGHFHGRHKCITPKWFKIQPIQSLETVVSSSTWRHKSDTFWLHRKKSSTSPNHLSPHSTDDKTKAPVTFSWYLIFYVKNYFDLLSIASCWLGTNIFEEGSVTDVLATSWNFFLPRT